MCFSFKKINKNVTSTTECYQTQDVVGD